MNSLRSIYGLSYDNSNFNSGLVNWYNRMIDKSLDELDVVDISKMLRQNILKEVALEKAVDLFIADPYSGEFDDGGLLDIIVSQNHIIDDKNKAKELKELLSKLELEYLDFDWSSENLKNQYCMNVKKLMSALKVSD